MRVAVVGAGAAGLVAARELAREGHEPVVLEASDEVGGTWRYTERTEGVHSAMYASLRTNLPRDLMAFRDFPFEGEPRFPAHAAVLEYLERFADAFDLRRFVRLRRRVEAVQRDGDRFRVDGERFDAVVVANGHYSAPRLPALPGRFGGEVVHSHAYRRPERFAGRHVAVLGAKSSGVDISAELGEVAARVFLCARGAADGWLGGREQVAVRPAIAELGPGRSVQLVDGRRLAPIDVVVLATGYRYAFPFLDDRTLVEVLDNWVHPLYLDLIAARAPRLAFIGLPFMVIPFPQFEVQARFFAKTLSGAVALPSKQERLRWVEEHVAALDAAGVAVRHRLRHDERQFAYFDDLADRCGAPPLPDWFAPLARACAQQRRHDPYGYREAKSLR